MFVLPRKLPRLRAQLVWLSQGKWKTSELKSPTHQKGNSRETTGPQGAKQTATVTFTARGEHKYELNSSAVIDETVEPYIVDKDGNRATLDGDGYYVVPGQGKYKITANGKDVDVEFIPEDNFLGTADGISIRRSDNNGYDTGWSTKFPRSRTKH